MGKKLLIQARTAPSSPRKKKKKVKKTRRYIESSLSSDTPDIPQHLTIQHTNNSNNDNSRANQTGSVSPLLFGSFGAGSSGIPFALPNQQERVGRARGNKKGKHLKGDNDSDIDDDGDDNYQRRSSDSSVIISHAGKPKIDFLKDRIEDMTYGRRIALHLMKKPWYNPQLREQDNHRGDGDDDDDKHNDDSSYGSKFSSDLDDDEETQEDDDEDDDDEDDDDDEYYNEPIEVFEDDGDREYFIEQTPKRGILRAFSHGSLFSQKSFERPGFFRTSSVQRSLAAASSKGGNKRKANKKKKATIKKLEKEVHNSADGNGEQEPLVESRPPTVTRKERPSLAKAWAYFEHVTLPRYLVEEDFQGHGIRRKRSHELSRAEPGEDDDLTQLYHPNRTHSSQLGDFGLGIGLYFSSVWAIAALLFLAGCLNIPNILYFSSQEYSNHQLGVPFLLKGSAICTNTSWVPCPDCPANKFHPSRFATASTELNVMGLSMNTTVYTNNLTFALHNDCKGVTVEAGMINLATLMLIVVGMVVVSIRQAQYEILFDEDEQTAQDYSIHVKNPPQDAYDPEEWRSFFREKCGAHATAVTVALDNDLLLNTLVQRRECIRKIELMVPPGTKLDTMSLARLAAEVEKYRTPFERFKHKFVAGLPELFSKIASLDAKIEGLAQLNYKVRNVFASFEYEEHQRKVLSILSASYYQSKHSVNYSGIKFRDEKVLLVEEPHEPNTILWANLNERLGDLFKAMVTTTICALVSIVLIAMMIRFLSRTQSHAIAAIAISLSNILFPHVAKFLTSFERHNSESQRQTSLYFKINVFRWVNTAIVITIVTPFDKTLTSDGLLKSIYSILFADIITSNVLHLADIIGHIKRHILAPRAPTQDMMNLHMKGADFDLAERFTNMTKVIFVALWFCPIYPGGLFLSSIGLFCTYYVDRFNLMRTWARKPMLGTTIARFSRYYFFPLAMAINAIVAAYTWAGFPYDSLCDTTTVVPTDYVGSWQLHVNDNTVAESTVLFGSTAHRYCSQRISDTRATHKFPVSPGKLQRQAKEWMTSQQIFVVEFYGWTSLFVTAFVGWYMLFLIVKFVEQFFRNHYEPTGEDQEIPFSAVKSISTYVPQVPSRLFSYPLLGCDIDGIDPEIFDWTDPDRPHSYYDLTKDAMDLVGKECLEQYHVFSKLSHAPPKAAMYGGTGGTTYIGDSTGEHESLLGSTTNTHRSVRV